MSRIKRPFYLLLDHMAAWRRSPRVIVTFLLAFVMCLMLTDKVITFSYRYDTLLQIAETFVWTFSDGTSILLSTFLLFILFSDMPFTGGATPYRIYRTGRRGWMAGQLLYTALAVLAYELFLAIATVLLSLGRAYPGNQWSETAAMLGYSKAGEALSLTTAVRALEHSTPYRAAFAIFFLVFLYIFWIATVLFIFTLCHKYVTGLIVIIAINLSGIVLQADTVQKIMGLSEQMAYKAHVLFGWISPLNHSVYAMHSFGYDRLPRLWMSTLLLLCLISINCVLLFKKMEKYEFSFTDKVK